MTSASSAPRTLADADAHYVAFSPFSDWSQDGIDFALWRRYAERLLDRRAHVGQDAAEYGMRQTLIAAALNTGAIEGLHRAGRGLTITVIEHASNWQRHVRNAEGPNAEAHVTSALEALDMALDVATNARSVSESWIRELHSVATRPQNEVETYVPVGDELVQQILELRKGEYKAYPNHVRLVDGTYHSYCPIFQVAPEMARLVAELSSDQFKAAHPITKCAYAHHALVTIHPFQDGNGRVARALGSIYLLHAASIPLLIYEDQQAEYFDALEAADAGRHEDFTRFVQHRALDLLANAYDLLSTSPEGSAIRLERPVDRVPPASIEAADRLHEVVATEAKAALDEIPVGEGIDVTVGTMGYSVGARDPEGRRTVRDTFPYVTLRDEQYGVRREWWFAIYVSDRDDMPYPIALRLHGGAEMVELRISDVYPTVTVSALQRVRAFVRRITRENAKAFQEELESR